MNMTTVQLDRSLVSSLKDLREYPRQTYNELVSRMIDVFKNVRSKNQYDEFLHKVQQMKMRELWNNPSDDEWDHG